MKLTKNEHDTLVNIFALKQVELALTTGDVAKGSEILSVAEGLGIKAEEIIVRVLELADAADGEIVVEGE